MKKKVTAVVLCATLMVSLMVGCGLDNTPADEMTTEMIEVEEEFDDVEEQNSASQEVNSNTSLQEKLHVVVRKPEIEDISDEQKTIFFYRNGMKIFAKLHLPEGEGPFPLVIFSYGTNGFYTQTENMAQVFAKEGIAGLAFDFTGTERGSQSEGTIAEASVLTQAADLEAIIDSLEYLPYIDKDNVFLWGHSQGGFVATIAAVQRPDGVKGVIGAEPGYNMQDQMAEAYPNIDDMPDVIYEPFAFGRKYMKDLVSFDIFEMIPSYKNPVLIIAADTEPSIGAEYKEYLDRAEEEFPAATQVVVEGANHQFPGQTYKEMQQLSLQFVKDNIK